MHYLNKILLALVLFTISCKSERINNIEQNIHSNILDKVLKTETVNSPSYTLELYEKMGKDSLYKDYETFLNKYTETGLLLVKLDNENINKEEQSLIKKKLSHLTEIAYYLDFNNIKEEGFELIQQSKTKTDFRIALNYILYLDNQNRTSNIAYDPFN